MRKCIRCNADMVENLESGLKLRRPATYKKTEVDLKAAMCPKCGFVELYTDELSQIEKFSGVTAMDK